jgi:hypothetical protein
MTDKELMQQALDALESECDATKFGAAEALRARLAQPELEPVAWTPKIERLYDKNGFLLHQKIKRTPSSEWEDYYPEPQREWQGLTDEEIMDACSAVWASHPIEVGRVVEAKLKEKNS